MKELCDIGINEPEAQERAWGFFEEAKKELRVKNRFSNDKLDRLVSRLVNIKSFCYTLPVNTIMYRSRIYSEKDGAIRHRRGCKEDVFNGYDRENSYVNPENCMVAEGRCNPEYISYLYASQSVECSIQEMRPNIHSFISVADIKVLEELNLLGLDKDEPVRDTSEYIVKGVSDSLLLYHLNMAFCSPWEEYGDYLLSQYISEKIKNHGFDGISFKSAVYDEEGKNTNYVVFNYKKCEPIASKLYRTKKITISYE